MKQGRASRDVKDGRYQDPRGRGVSVLKVSSMGTMKGNHATGDGRKEDMGKFNEPMYTGRVGFPGAYQMPQKCCPGGGRNIYPKGAQGKR